MINGRPKTGGRQKGVKNKKTAELERIVKDGGITPLDYMLSVMREEIPDETDPLAKAQMTSNKMDAAKSAAPYVHAKLSAIEIKAEVEEVKKVISSDPIDADEWQSKHSK